MSLTVRFCHQFPSVSFDVAFESPTPGVTAFFGPSGCGKSTVSALAGIAASWHSKRTGELYPRAGFIVTKMSRPAENVVAFYNKRGRCEQWIKEGKGAIKWTRLSCRTFAANAVRLQLHALAYNLGDFLRTLATPEPIGDWSMTSPKEKLLKIGAKVVSHGRYIAFQMAEVTIPRGLFADILCLIVELRASPDLAPA
jgi:Transposase DDE domain group 1